MNSNVSIAEDIAQTMAIQRSNISELIIVTTETDYCCYIIVMRAQIVDSQDVSDILFPPEIDPAQLSEFGSGQSILPASFLINRGAKSITLTTHTHT